MLRNRAPYLLLPGSVPTRATGGEFYSGDMGIFTPALTDANRIETRPSEARMVGEPPDSPRRIRQRRRPPPKCRKMGQALSTYRLAPSQFPWPSFVPISMAPWRPAAVSAGQPTQLQSVGHSGGLGDGVAGKLAPSPAKGAATHVY